MGLTCIWNNLPNLRSDGVEICRNILIYIKRIYYSKLNRVLVTMLYLDIHSSTNIKFIMVEIKSAVVNPFPIDIWILI